METNELPPIRLVIADVDGTLVTNDKVLTPRAIAAVRSLKASGIAFAIVSGRPPLGMKMFVEPLELQEPLAAFNGGVLVTPRFEVLQQKFVPQSVAEQAIATLAKHELDIWVYTDLDWLVRNIQAPHVARSSGR